MARAVDMSRRRRALAAGLAATALVAPAVLRAQAYPARPVRLVVPFPPGGTTDIVARAFADLFARELGQPVVIDYRPGAVTNIGTESVGRAAPDGYTLLFGSSVMATNFATGPVPPFDPLLLSQKGSIFITRPTLMHHTAKREELEELGGELFAMVASGKIRIEVNQTYALADAAQSHIDLEARRTTGSTILLP